MGFYAVPTPMHVWAALIRISVLLKKEKKTPNTCKVKRESVVVIGGDRRKNGGRYDHKFPVHIYEIPKNKEYFDNDAVEDKRRKFKA